MEKIDLNNYEAYFLDFMEGSLSAEEKAYLFTFLEAHPELKNEFELDFGEMALFPVTITFENKAELKIDEADLIITPNTLPDLMVASIEQQLSFKHEQQLISYIDKNELSTLHASYRNAILKPDLAIVFEEKKRLKQKGGLLISTATFKRAAAIAAVGLVLVTLTINWGGNSGNSVLESQAKFVNDQVKTKFLNGFVVEGVEENSTDIPVEIDAIKSPKQSNPKEVNSVIESINNGGLAEQKNEVKNDSLPSIQPTLNTLKELPNEYELVKEEKNVPTVQPLVLAETEEIYANIRKEEPYKIVTDAAANLVNKDVKFTRERNVAKNDYVAYSFKVGNFEFEHKKSSK